ncbi:MAG: eukaryotic-like serine/threonine-protein kinase [Acidobacteriota bacterium]|jgi:serine/threonine protein kinase|nr:eukaryotic-like serine/threonine-protein kinase [Acidobacteriota bacterium]
MTELKLQQSLLDGRYEILECLGRGSYAEIYVARDLSAADGEPQTVVIKVLNVLLQGVPDADLERTLIENFQNEAVALDRVRHPNIISRLGHGTAIDLVGTAFHYIVLEYLAGGELGARVRQQPFSLERALFYLEQVCSGLAHAHDCGVIHRDIKPQNLLLTADGQTVKIADFGVAKLEATEGAITRVGTNIYAAPEHNPLVQTGPLDTASLSSSQPHLTPAADIYSLAKTTYTLLAGEAPRRFSHHQIRELPESIANKTWGKDVLRVLRRATEDKPGDRYQTVQEFWEELSDASLPPTQLLRPPGGEAGERRVTKQLPSKTEAVVEAPPRPRFDSRDVIKRTQMGGNGSNRPRIVVPVAATQHNLNFPTTGAAVRSPAHDGTVHVPVQHVQSADEFIAAQQEEQVRGRGFRALVALLIIVVFAGILLATHYYVSRQRASSSSPTASEPSEEVGLEGIVRTDVRLRPDPSVNNRANGIVTTGSRVRVLSVKNNWYEIEVLQQGRDDPQSANRGWINKRFLDAN